MPFSLAPHERRTEGHQGVHQLGGSHSTRRRRALASGRPSAPARGSRQSRASSALTTRVSLFTKSVLIAAPRDNASKPSSLRRPSPRHVPTIRVTRPSTGTAGCATPAAVRRRQKSQASSKSSKSETRNRSPRVKPDAAASRRLPKRKSLAGLFGVALKRSSDMLRMAPSTPLVTPQHSPKALRRLADTIDGAGHHLIAASAGQQPMSMSDTSPDTAAFFSRVGGRGIDNPRIIRSQRELLFSRLQLTLQEALTMPLPQQAISTASSKPSVTSVRAGVVNRPAPRARAPGRAAGSGTVSCLPAPRVLPPLHHLVDSARLCR